jgi:hypothetical protein
VTFTKRTAYVAAAGLSAMALSTATPAQDIPVPDYTHLMGVYGAEDAVMEAAGANPGSGTSRPRQRKTTPTRNPRTASRCRFAREKVVEGTREARYRQALALCKRMGY